MIVIMITIVTSDTNNNNNDSTNVKDSDNNNNDDINNDNDTLSVCLFVCPYVCNVCGQQRDRNTKFRPTYFLRLQTRKGLN